VDADHQRMMQIMEELLSNAAKFSHSGGHIEVSLERHDGSLHAAIKDQGNGIDEKYCDTLSINSHKPIPRINAATAALGWV
jgi:signal transduction histidine kinase